MLFHIVITLARKSSLVRHRLIIAATTNPITPPTAHIAADQEPNAAPADLTTVTAAGNPLIILGRNPIESSIAPPTTSNTDDSANNIAISCLVDSDRLLNPPARLVRHSANFLIA